MKLEIFPALSASVIYCSHGHVKKKCTEIMTH